MQAILTMRYNCTECTSPAPGLAGRLATWLVAGLAGQAGLAGHQAADRGIYVCQSQSLNLYLKNPDLSKLSSMHMYTWSKGLKTGIYYLRTKSVARAQQFTIEPENTNVCEMCSA